MVVSWKPPRNFSFSLQRAINLVLVLCPASAVGAGAKDMFGKDMSEEKGERKQTDDESGDPSTSARYLCALVTPGLMVTSYEVNLWRQFVVDTDMMFSEVFLEYDDATRYYYMAV